MEKSKKPTILLLHGLRGSHHGLKRISAVLSAAGFEVLSPDLPGSGENPELKEQDMMGMITWLRIYIEETGVKPVLVGHSMGSILVSHYVLRHPETVDERVVLIAPIVRGTGMKIASRALDGAVKGALIPFSEKWRTKILKSHPASWAIARYLMTDKTMKREILEFHYEYGPMFASARSLYGDMKISTQNQTEMPKGKKVLVIFGKKDRLSSNKVVHEWLEETGAEFFEVDGTGHLINYERPREVGKRILEFLET